MLLYGRLAGPTAHVRVGDFLYGEKVLEGEICCDPAERPPCERTPCMTG